MRKTGQTKFLDNLKQSLLKRMEEADGWKIQPKFKDIIGKEEF
jgi:hypothetical protein